MVQLAPSQVFFGQVEGLPHSYGHLECEDKIFSSSGPKGGDLGLLRFHMSSRAVAAPQGKFCAVRNLRKITWSSQQLANQENYDQ